MIIRRLFRRAFFAIACAVVIFAVLAIGFAGCNEQTAQFFESILASGEETRDLSQFIRSSEANTGTKDESPTENNTAEHAASLKVNVLDVGQGSCAIFESNGEIAVIDTGDSAHAQVPVAYLKRLNPPSIKYLINTHWDEDHCGAAVGILKNFRVENVYGADYAADTRTYRSLMDYVSSNGVSYSVPSVGTVLTLGKSTITVIGPVRNYEEENSKSIVCIVSDGTHSVFIGGDCTVESEKDLIAAWKLSDVDVYIVNHHGSNSSSCQEFLQTIRPEYSIISCSKDSGFGHPTSKVLSRIGSVGSELYRTDVQGDVVFEFTADGIRFEKEPTENWTPGVYDPSKFSN